MLSFSNVGLRNTLHFSQFPILGASSKLYLHAMITQSLCFVLRDAKWEGKILLMGKFHREEQRREGGRLKNLAQALLL